MDSDDKAMISVVAIVAGGMLLLVGIAVGFGSYDTRNKNTAIAECVKAGGRPLDCKAALEK